MRILWLFIALFSTQLTIAQGNKQITIDDLWKNNTFKVKDVPGFNAMKDGLHYTKIDKDGKHQYIRVYNLETGTQERTLFDNDLQKADTGRLSVEEYTFSANEQKMLLCTISSPLKNNCVL